MRKNLFKETISKAKQYMSEQGRPLQVDEIAEHLKITKATAYGILALMEAFGITQKMKRGKTYYLLKGIYNDEQISAMLPPEKSPREKFPRIPRQRGRPRLPRPQPQDERDSFREEYLSDMKERTSSGDGLSALAILRLPQEWAAETPTTEPPVQTEPEPMIEEMKPKPLINNKPFGTVKYLPKDFRRLSQTEMRHLKNLLKGLDGCEDVERYKNVYSKFSALEHGRYGEVFYLSIGSNPWDIVRKITIDPTISNYMLLPKLEADIWSSWNDFLNGFKETRIYRRGQYDEIIDKFMESGHKLVEITMKNKDATYVKHMLKEKIEERGIMDQVKTSRVDEWVYLEKVE